MKPNLHIFLLVLAALLGSCRDPLVVDGRKQLRQLPWPADLVAEIERTPVQYEGRVKPWSTMAAFALYAIHGRRDMQFVWSDTPDRTGGKVVFSPTEWLLDVFFFPEQTAEYPLFRIENAEVFRALWPDERHQQSFDLEYVSFARLAPVAQHLFELAKDLQHKEEKDLSPFESQIQILYKNLNSYFQLQQQCVLLREPIRIEGTRAQAVVDGRTQVNFAELVAKAAPLGALATKLQEIPAAERGNLEQVGQFLSEEGQGGGEGGPALFPPPPGGPEQAPWLSFGDLRRLAVQQRLTPQLQRMLDALQQAVVGDEPARFAALQTYASEAIAGAGRRGEQSAVTLEAQYNAWNLHYWALHWFLWALVASGLALLKPQARWPRRAAIAVTILPILLLVGDIVLRCIVRGRPPVTNLYDTFLFIGAVATIAGLVAELVVRRGIALLVVAAVGAMLIQSARLFELNDAKDTMSPLQAVLNTNYYLAIHVTSINMGYAGGVLAATLGLLYLVLDALHVKRRDREFYKSLARMTYGVTAFALIFAVFGTIFGGVWAEDSWGRFWGWDPKENGALLICLSLVALMHARMCGWVRDYGFCAWSAITGMVVLFSWFHVNLLGIGLHSYGFSRDLKASVLTYYGVQGGILALCLSARYIEWLNRASAEPQAGELASAK